MNKLLRQPAVSEATGLAYSTMYKMIAEGKFPKPVKLTERTVAWREEAVQEWIDNREDSELVSINPKCRPLGTKNKPKSAEAFAA